MSLTAIAAGTLFGYAIAPRRLGVSPWLLIGGLLAGVLAVSTFSDDSWSSAAVETDGDEPDLVTRESEESPNSATVSVHVGAVSVWRLARGEQPRRVANVAALLRMRHERVKRGHHIIAGGAFWRVADLFREAHK